MLHRRTIRQTSTTGLLVLILAAGFLLSACGEPEAGEVSALAADPSGEILFVSEHNIMIWRDGDVDQLTRDHVASSPTWSPHGDRFAYIQVHEDYSELVIADRDGDPLMQVTDHDSSAARYTEEHVFVAAWAWDPVWSPVDEEVAYISDKEGLDQFSRTMYVWVAEQLDQQVPPYILNASYQIGMSQEDPSYAPDGSELVFTVRVDSEDGGRSTEIWTLDLETAVWEQLVASGDGVYDPVWAPDGESVAFVQRQGDANEIWIAPVGDGEPYQLTSGGNAVEPTWSPDGSHIAFIEQGGPEFQISVVEVTADDDGEYSVVGDPEVIVSEPDIDAQSGLSWNLP